MKKLSLLLFSLICFAACDSSSIVGVSIIIIIGFLAIACLIMAVRAGKKEREEEEKEKQRLQAEKEEKDRIEKERLHNQYLQREKEISEKYGNADKIICLDEENPDTEIRVYLKQKLVTVQCTDVSFSSILQCTFSDNPTTIKGKTTIVSTGTTKTSTGDAILRTAVGEAFGGAMGGVIGGVTAKKNTTTTSTLKSDNDYVVHDYTVLLTTKDIINPLIRIHIGNNTVMVNEIVAMFNSVIANK